MEISGSAANETFLEALGRLEVSRVDVVAVLVVMGVEALSFDCTPDVNSGFLVFSPLNIAMYLSMFRKFSSSRLTLLARMKLVEG